MQVRRPPALRQTRRLPLFLVALLAPACASGTVTPSPTSLPGWYDVGVGYGYASDVGGGATEVDADGIVVSLKAYPWRKWYRANAVERMVVTLEGSDVGALSDGTAKFRPDQVGTDVEWLGFDVLRGYDNWYNHVAVFYGRSVGDFVTGAGDSEVDVLGLSYDVAPQFALQAGVAVHRFNGDAQRSFFVGVSLNAMALASVFGVGVDATPAGEAPKP